MLSIILLLLNALRLRLAATLFDEEKPLAATIEIPVDHFNTSDTRTYMNHYLLYDFYYEKGGPVFFYDGGEAGIPKGQIKGSQRGMKGIFAPVQLARKYGGMVIIWEHRFYGSSLPFEIDPISGHMLEEEDAYKYLTNEQALQDAVFFAMHFSPPGHNSHHRELLRAQNTPWIWIGASYAGSRAAMIRQRNPDVFFASWASSAPVEIVVDGSVYWNVVEQSLPRNCSADVHAAITYADTILLSGSSSSVALLRRAVSFVKAGDSFDRSFNFEGSHEPNDMDHMTIATVLSYPFLGSRLSFQFYGLELAIRDFCEHLEKWNPKSFPGFNISSPPSSLFNNSDDSDPTSAGVAATYGSESAFYAYIYAMVIKRKTDSVSLHNTSIGEKRIERAPVDRISWAWQLCTEFGGFQVSQATNLSNPETNLISRFLNISSTLRTFCHAQFPYAPKLPNVQAVRKYGGWKMAPSRVMWTNGQLDPFRTLGVHADRKINPRAMERKTTKVVPRCESERRLTVESEIFGIQYEGAVHAKDIRRPKDGNGPGCGTGSPVDDGLKLFEAALDVWLKCFAGRLRTSEVEESSDSVSNPDSESRLGL